MECMRTPCLHTFCRYACVALSLQPVALVLSLCYFHTVAPRASRHKIAVAAEVSRRCKLSLSA